MFYLFYLFCSVQLLPLTRLDPLKSPTLAIDGLPGTTTVFVAGWRYALRSEWPFIIIIYLLPQPIEVAWYRYSQSMICLVPLQPIDSLPGMAAWTRTRHPSSAAPSPLPPSRPPRRPRCLQSQPGSCPAGPGCPSACWGQAHCWQRQSRLQGVGG